MKYYVRAGERNLGPYSLDELRQRGLGPDEYVWSDGMSDWRRAAEVPELGQVVKSPGLPAGPPAYSSVPVGGKASPYASPGDYMDYGGTPGPSNKPHSGYGIAACIVGGVMAAITAAIFVATVLMVGDAKNPKDLEHRPIFMLLGATMCGSPLLYIIGLVLGLVGWFQPDRHKAFSIVGTVLNAVCLIGILGFLVLGMLVAAAGR